MAVTYVGGNSNVGTGATISVDLTALTGGSASSAAAGDVVVVNWGWATNVGADAALTMSTADYNYAFVDVWANDTREANMRMAWKIMPSTPDTTAICNGPNNAAYGGGIAVQVWRGVHRTSTLTGTASGTSALNGNHGNPPAITPAVDDAVVICGMVGSGATTATGTKTAPTNYTTYNVATKGDGTGADAYVSISARLLSGGSGASEDPGAYSSGNTTTSDGWCAGTLALAPASTKTLTETASLGNVLTVQLPGVNAAETAVLGHSTLKLLGIVLMEAMSLVDPAVTSKLTSRTLFETATLTDPTVVTEKTGGAGSYTKELTEGLGLIDSFERVISVSTTRTEALGLTDSHTKTATIYHLGVEQLTAATTVNKAVARELTETIGLADVPSKGVSRTLEQYLWLIHETLNPDGAFTTTSVTVNLSGFPPMAEVYAADLVNDSGNYENFQLSWSSSGPWTASIRFHAVVDSMLLVYVKGTPLGGGTDLQRVSFVTVTDNSQLVEPYSGTVGLTATLTKVASLTRHPVETLGLTDSIQNQYSGGANNYTQTLTEVAGLTDSLSKGAGKQLTDALLAGPVAWVSNPTYYSVSGNSFTRSAVNGTVGLIASTEALGGYGWVQFTAAQNNKSSGVGFSFTVPDEANSYADIDFFILLNSSGTAGLLKNGNFQFTLGSYTAGDVFTIQWSRRPLAGAVISIWKNSTEWLVSAIPSYPLYFYGWVFEQNAGVNNVRFGVDEQLLLTTRRTLTESQGLGDTVQNSRAKLFTEALSLGDLPSKATDRTISNQLALSDQLTKAKTHQLTESLALTDVVVRGGDRARTLTESLGLADLTVAADHTPSSGEYTKTLTEGATLLDVRSVDLSRQLVAEQAVLSHATLKLLGVVLYETTSLTDPTATTVLAHQAFTENAVLTDSLTLSLTGQQQLTEMASLVEVVKKDTTKLRTEGGGAALELGAHTSAHDHVGDNGTSLTTGSITTQASGSCMIVGVARAVATTAVPTDSKSNTYAQIGSTVGYTDWPTWGTSLFSDLSIAGGSGHTVTIAYPDGDEATVFALEVKGGAAIEDWAHAQNTNQSPLVSGNVTTAGPALLIAFCWGNGGGVTEPHNATPNNDFVVADSVTGYGSFIQGIVATKYVSAAGTYNVSWTADDPGGQTWLVAVQGSGTGAASPKLLDTLVTLKGLARERTETLSLTSSLTKGAGHVVQQGLSISDVLVKNLAAQKLLTETVGLTDSRQRGSSHTLIEGVGLTATPSKGESRALLEAAGLAGTLSLTQTQKQLSEQLSLSDVKETQHGGNSTKQLSDLAQLTDTFSRQVSYQRTLNESSTLGDTTRKDEGRTRTETTTLSDSLLRAAGGQRTETVSLSDSPSKAVSKTFIEGLGLSDLVTEAGSYPKTLTDGLTLGAGLSKSVGRVLTEGVGVADQPVAAQHTPYGGNHYPKELTEQLALSRILTKGSAKQLVEATSLNDSLTRLAGRTRILTEGAGLLDSLQKSLGKQRTESLGLGASLTTGKAKILSEGLGLSDQLLKQAAAARVLVEVASLSDVAEVGTETKTLFDGLALGAGIQKSLSRTLTETASLTESFNAPKTINDGLVLEDFFEYGFNRRKDFKQQALLLDTLEVAYGLAGAAAAEELLLADEKQLGLERVLVETLGVRSTVAAPDLYAAEGWFPFAG